MIMTLAAYEAQVAELEADIERFQQARWQAEPNTLQWEMISCDIARAQRRLIDFREECKPFRLEAARRLALS